MFTLPGVHPHVSLVMGACVVSGISTKDVDTVVVKGRPSVIVELLFADLDDHELDRYSRLLEARGTMRVTATGKAPGGRRCLIVEVAS